MKYEYSLLLLGKREQLLFAEAGQGREELPGTLPGTLWGGSPEESRNWERGIVAQKSGLPIENVISLRQEHGARLFVIGPQELQENRERFWSNSGETPFFGIGDGLYTELPQVALSIRSADCLPLFLYFESSRAQAVALLHAGWRGLQAGMVGENLLKMLFRFDRHPNGSPIRLTYLLGPHADAESYEVGEEVASCFSPLFLKKREERYLLDMAAVARQSIESALEQYSPHSKGNSKGSSNRHSPSRDSSSRHGRSRRIIASEDSSLQGSTIREERFYSHRRREKGRNLNVIWLRPKP